MSGSSRSVSMMSPLSVASKDRYDGLSQPDDDDQVTSTRRRLGTFGAAMIVGLAFVALVALATNKNDVVVAGERIEMEVRENGVPLRGDFFISNKQYSQARIAQPSTTEIGPYDGAYYADQLWNLKEEPNEPGYYYITNVYRSGYRIAKYGSGDRDLGPYNGHYYKDQLWKFVKEGDFYRIYNKHYPSAKLTQFKNGGELITYTGANYNDQLWKLTPRFEANIGYKVVWAADNRQGSQPYSQKVSVERGVKKTKSQTSSLKLGFKTSLEVSASYAAVSAKMTAEISSEISRSVSSSTEETVLVKSEVTYTAPAGKNYRVLQYAGSFASKLATDGASVYGNYKIEEVTGDLPPIPSVMMVSEMDTSVDEKAYLVEFEEMEKEMAARLEKN